MKEINLRKLYPFYHTDMLVEVPDKVADTLAEAERQEKNFVRRRYWNKAHCSLNGLPPSQARRRLCLLHTRQEQGRGSEQGHRGKIH